MNMKLLAVIGLSSLSAGAGVVPGVRYEAERASLDGKAVLRGPTIDQKEIAAQASDNRYVELPAAGSGLVWTVGEDGADGVTLRFTMPDRADGWKQANPDDEVPQYRRADVFDGALEVRVNGKARKVRQYGAVSDRVPLSSYWMWQYFNGDHPADEPNAPYQFARFAFDEVHFILDGAPLRKGDRLSLVNPDGKFPYGVDFVELEKVPAPIPQPANALSVADFGTGREAIDRCFAACREQRKTMYFPAGVWEYWAKTGDNRWLLSGASNLKITGAGVWHTNLHFPGSKSFGGGVGGDRKAVGTEFCHLYLSSMLRSRFNQNAVYKGIMEAWGDKASIHDLWIEHFECGMWFGDYQSPALPTTNARIFNCRIRNNLADGVNLCQGTSDTVIERCSFRGNGDDGIAIWNNDACGAQDTVRNVIRDNVIECNWRAGSIAIFGGDGHLIANNLIKDGYKGAGIRLNTDFPGHQFRNTKLIRFVSNTVVNCGTSWDCYGGASFNQPSERGAVDFQGQIRNVTFEHTKIVRAHRAAIQMLDGEKPGIRFVDTEVDTIGLDRGRGSKFTYPEDVGPGRVIYLNMPNGPTVDGLKVRHVPEEDLVNKQESERKTIVWTRPAEFVRADDFITTTFAEPWQDLSASVRVVKAAKPTLAIDPAAADQEVLGFGTALSELSWKALSALEYPIWNGVLDEIFKAGGANLTVIRLPMGASDFALDWYSYDEEPGDFNMDKFSTARENDTLLPLLRAILERNRDEARVWASPWSPPRWMKKSGCYASKPQANPRAPQNDCTPAKRVREGEDGFICDDAHFAAYARYFRRYVDGYKSAGFPMWAVMPQNEFNSDQVFPSCTWKASSLARFMGKYLGPALEGSGVELFFGTMERPSFEMARTVLDDPDCRKYVKGAGFQWAGKDAIGPVHRKYPGLFLMQTEQECGDGRNDWTHARHCWDLMRHYFSNGASAYEYWNLALASDSVSRWGWRQNSLVTVDVKAKTYRFNAEYYVLKQLSHFVKRGAKRLKTANGDWIAFRNPDGSVVVGLGNKGPAREVTVACGGRVRAVELPADSVSTLVLVD